ncbi:DegV family protein [Tissierella carlieri]|uniref:DegV family protein n=1 Tax=Tissierella carlieri TaxID=689904 RepID=A0ABT1S8Q3_9FIRM|nr:DegV family protein [Tissierella carlieri]MBU5312448.1 DegV family protein [Tissierella carlieri]MCQ4922855.1 DegV family protein [Tissierella carlieri]MDU5081064.1 DegV family protein [Bacillota bacterium]
MIKIMADSTCDLSKKIVDKYNIGVAPLNIIISGTTYRDKIDIETDEFFKILPTLEELPTTSMPSPEEYLKIINKAIEDGYKEILCICMSSGTSGSYQSAVLAKDYFFENNPNSTVKIYVVDSLSMSHGSGWLILKSAMLLESGYSFDELIQFNENYKTKVKHFLCVDDLNNLIKSGRLTNASAFIGKLLRVKPIMSMKKGKGAIVAKERGRNRVLKFYVDEFIRRVDNKITDFVIIGYTSDMNIAKDLAEKIRLETDFKDEIYIMQMGAAVGTHVGLGGLSMFFVEKENLKDGLVKNEIRSIRNKKDELIEKIRG